MPREIVTPSLKNFRYTHTAAIIFEIRQITIYTNIEECNFVKYIIYFVNVFGLYVITREIIKLYWIYFKNILLENKLNNIL